MAETDNKVRESGEERPGASERSNPPENFFRIAWEEINERMSSLRQDLELSERSGLGEETREVLVRKLVALQKTVDAFAERWMDFERKRKSLEEKLGKEPLGPGTL